MTDPSPRHASSGPLICPGCGGRNETGSLECDWCGRIFASPSRRLRVAGWQLASSALVLLMLGAVIALFALNSNRALSTFRPATTTPLAVASVSPTPAVTPRVTAAADATARPTPSPTLPSGIVPAASPEPSEPPPRLARVANTDGRGVSVRAEPGANAPAVGSLREGAQVQLTGQQQTVAARLWREVLDPSRGLQGWVSSDFLELLP